MKAKTMKPVMPSSAIERQYGKQITEMVKAMHKSVLYWIAAAYKKAEPTVPDVEVATDAAVRQRQLRLKVRHKKRRQRHIQSWNVKQLNQEINDLMTKWEKKFDEFAGKAAEKYVGQVDGQARRVIDEAFRAAGFNVQQRLTPELKAVMQSAVIEQANLIRSIPRQYHFEVAHIVQDCFQANRDVRTLSAQLKERYNLTQRRAYLIAKDQTAKMTDTISRTRNMALGVTEGIWMHRAGGSKTYRESHVRMNGQRFDLAKGCYDPAIGKYIHPGDEINCKCTYRPVIPAFMNTAQQTAEKAG